MQPFLSRERQAALLSDRYEITKMSQLHERSHASRHEGQPTSLFLSYLQNLVASRKMICHLAVPSFRLRGGHILEDWTIAPRLY